jgi:iron complex outermembrane receptor protein
MVAQPVYAQEKSDKAEKLETIEVVGSRIKRTDVETSQPVFVLERQDLQRTGLTSIGDILQHISTNGATLNTTFNNGGDGETRINLRDLGSQRTLVLVNGHRWITGAGGAVDLNTIPVSIIERVEILKDGASSIYGSDAIAGVVNITTRSNYDGAEATAYVGENEHGDGRVEAYDFTIGANTEKANIVMNVSYNKQEPILAGDRHISQNPSVNIPGNNVNTGASSTTPFGRFRTTAFGAPGLTFDPTLTSAGSPTVPAGFRPFNLDEDGFNFAPDNYLSTPQDRTSLFVQARYQLSDAVAFKTEVLYNERKSEQQLAASPLTIGAAFGIPIDIAPGQEFNPFHQNLNRVQYRPFKFKRQFDQEVQTYRFAGGFEGQFSLFDRNWSWDMNYQYAQNNSDTITKGLINIPNFIASLENDCGPDGNGVACADIFHGPDGFTQDMFNAISFIAHDSSRDKLWNYTANITGDLWELPAGPLGFAAGYEYRRVSGDFVPDAFISAGFSSGNAAQPTAGGYALDEFYSELNVPILKDMTFAELLELNLAVRYSDYSNFGNTTNPKAGFRWKPFSDLLVRGNWSKGFRAPSVSELFGGNADSFPTLADPCSAGNIVNISAEAQNRCRNGFAGISGTPVGYSQANSQIRITVGGNPNVLPERTITKTLGLVYSPSWAQGLDIYLDWYNIQLRDAIGTPLASGILNSCYLVGNATACQQAGITRTGTGDITNLFAGTQNLVGGLETEGYDFTVNYKLDTQYGKFNFNWDNTYTSYFGELGKPHRLDCVGGTVEIPGLPSSCTGFLAGGNTVGNYFTFDPKWRVRSNLTTNWSYGDWGATVGMRYYSAMDEDCSNPANFGFSDLCSDPNRVIDVDGSNVGSPAPQNRVGSRTYVDLQGTWDAPWNARFTVGVNNVADRDPPISYSSFANSFDPQYPVPGRFWYVQYTQKF